MKRWVAMGMAAVWAIAPCRAEEPAGRAADHEALRALKTRAVTALEQRDMNALMGCFAKEFVFTAIDQTVITSKEQLAAFNERIFAGKDAPLAGMKIQPEADVLTRFLAADVGYCYGKALETYTMRDGRVFSMANRWTATIVKEDGNWRIAAVHSGVNFMDNPILAARSMSFWRKLGVALHLCKAPWEKAG